MLNSKSLSMNTIEGCYKNKIRFDIKGIPIKKGKPNSHHISYLDNIPPFTNTLVSIHEVESYKMDNAENNFDRLSRDRDLATKRKLVVVLFINNNRDWYCVFIKYIYTII